MRNTRNTLRYFFRRLPTLSHPVYGILMNLARSTVWCLQRIEHGQLPEESRRLAVRSLQHLKFNCHNQNISKLLDLFILFPSSTSLSAYLCSILKPHASKCGASFGNWGWHVFSKVLSRCKAFVCSEGSLQKIQSKSTSMFLQLQTLQTSNQNELLGDPYFFHHALFPSWRVRCSLACPKSELNKSTTTIDLHQTNKPMSWDLFYDLALLFKSTQNIFDS